ncbi:glycosyl hydrolase [Fictibacillus phosphorivorans]|uniref:Glycosyl hydrolase n=1 Tax=Fictibacillus phosphorivorans TaxID=1221500 RepID=A0A163PV25_9BACL|nr:beta-galactosidase [Fictibacillus phosphorivorans]KZE64176.1 glycosyl hydrolase [Fictibacillus phosphorivorans]
MIEIKNKQIIIDGKPVLITCGEIHYYRLDKSDWQDRLDKLKETGCNAVATYVPWLWHEPVEGQFDFTGKTRPETDLAGFIDLCTENGFYFFVRPGPFIMAEMKNEGLPYWVYEKHPEIIPVGWDESEPTTPTVDYLAPGYLQEVRKYYEKVMEVITPRIYPNGGKIIAFQLDNEIGMLSWVSNTPDLTDNVLNDLSNWLSERYGDNVSVRYPFSLEEGAERNAAFRSPKEEYAAQLLKDLGYYMRYRFAKYIAILREYAEEFGVKDIPFVVNIHGTGGGRGLTYPIGISQLYESYTQGPGYISGSDIYFGDLDMKTFQDLYIINGLMEAVHDKDQPLTSVEFNCGDGNFGETLGERYDPSAADFKLRMCLVQGNRLINYYLFAGGKNARLDTLVDDGNDRIASTGERHGFAAPIGPEGNYNYTFPRMSRVNQSVMAVSDKLARMDEERDEVSFAFIPDYYMTEYRYPKSDVMREIISNIEANRGAGAWEIMGRAMLLNGYRFTAVDVQNKPLDAAVTPVLALPSARYMDSAIQEKLVSYLNDGGRILLYGEVPLFDMEGKDCTILAEALGVTYKGTSRDGHRKYLSIYGDSWASAQPEIRSGFVQRFDVGPDVTPILRVYGSGDVCGFESEVGSGRAIVIASSYRCDLPFFKKAFERLGSHVKLTHDYQHHGIFMTSTADEEGERFIHLLNLDGFDKEFTVYEDGKALFGGRKLLLQSKDGVMLPMNLAVGNAKIAYATAEITGVSADHIDFRLTQVQDVIAFDPGTKILPSADYVIEENNELTLVRSKKHAKVDVQLRVWLG